MSFLLKIVNNIRLKWRLFRIKKLGQELKGREDGFIKGNIEFELYLLERGVK